jgi:predicted  nucleic acid-binding Zn-ribbon protein
MTRPDAWLAVPLVVRGALRELEAAVEALAARNAAADELHGRVGALEAALADTTAQLRDTRQQLAASQGAASRVFVRAAR